MTDIRCDKPMRRSKESAGRSKWSDDIRRFRCKGECNECICGMIKLKDGTWEHVQVRK